MRFPAYYAQVLSTRQTNRQTATVAYRYRVPYYGLVSLDVKPFWQDSCPFKFFKIKQLNRNSDRRFSLPSYGQRMIDDFFFFWSLVFWIPSHRY